MPRSTVFFKMQMRRLVELASLFQERFDLALVGLVHSSTAIKGRLTNTNVRMLIVFIQELSTTKLPLPGMLFA